MPRLTIRSLAKLLAPLLWLSLTTGCGGKQGDEDPLGEVPEVRDMTSCSAPDGLTFEPIDVVADGSPQGYFENGRVEQWYTNADYWPIAPGVEENSYICPTPDTQARPAAEIDGGHCVGTDYESNYAFRIQAIALDEWGTIGTKWYTPGTATAPIDARDWDGISFWARRGCAPSAVPNSLVQGRFCAELPETAPDPDSECTDDPAAAAEDPSDDQVWTGRTMFVSVLEWHTDTWLGADNFPVSCDGEAEVDEEKCDQFGIGIGLDDEWRFYTIPFSSLSQRGYGAVADCLYLRELWGINLSLSPGDWDVWIDDISLYRQGDEPEERDECTDGPPEE